MLEIAYALVALALIVLIVYAALLVKKLGSVVDETQQTIKVLTSDVNVTLYQTNELLAKVNVLADDINGKVATIDPLFTAVADLSESVSDLNTSARALSSKATAAGSSAKTSLALGLAGKLLNRDKKAKGKTVKVSKK